MAIDIEVPDDMPGGTEAPEEGKTGDNQNDSSIFVPPAQGANPIL
jgi:hypothetical protein